MLIKTKTRRYAAPAVEGLKVLIMSVAISQLFCLTLESECCFKAGTTSLTLAQH